MKKICFLLIIMLPALAFAQSSSFFEKYSGHEGFTTVKISPKMFQLVASADPDDEAMSVIKEITGVTVLTLDGDEGKNAARAAALTKEANASIGEGYEELLSVKESGTDLKILARSAGEGVIGDLLIVGNDDGDFVYVNVSGKLDLKKLKDLDGKIDIKGFDHLKDIDTDKK
jgi:hypothetical protein